MSYPGKYTLLFLRLPMVIAGLQRSLIFIGHCNKQNANKCFHKHDSDIQLTELKTVNHVIAGNFLKSYRNKTYISFANLLTTFTRSLSF